MPVGDSSGKGENLTMSAIVPFKGNADGDDVLPSNFILQFVDTKGEIAYFDDSDFYPKAETDDILATFCYASPAFCEENPGLVKGGAGWYLVDDRGTYDYPMNAYPIPLGMGYEIKSTGDGSAYVQYAGEVCHQALKVGGARSKIACTGNATPRALTLSDFTVEKNRVDGDDVLPSNFILQFVDTKGEIAYFDDEDFYPKAETDDILAMFCYASPAFCAENPGLVKGGAGWYLVDDRGTYDYPMNAYPIPAGFGFEIKSTGDGSASIIIPKALD